MEVATLYCFHTRKIRANVGGVVEMRLGGENYPLIFVSIPTIVELVLHFSLLLNISVL